MDDQWFLNNVRSNEGMGGLVMGEYTSHKDEYESMGCQQQYEENQQEYILQWESAG